MESRQRRAWVCDAFLIEMGLLAAAGFPMNLTYLSFCLLSGHQSKVASSFNARDLGRLDDCLMPLSCDRSNHVISLCYHDSVEMKTCSRDICSILIIIYEFQVLTRVISVD